MLARAEKPVFEADMSLPYREENWLTQFRNFLIAIKRNRESVAVTPASSGR
jgi:hypothetical protein